MNALQCTQVQQGIEICRLLVRAGADPRVSTRSENTALHLLARVTLGNGPEWLEARKAMKALCQLLLERGANVNWKNAAGITPLHEAAFKGALDAATFFLEHNADTNLKTKQGVLVFSFHHN